MNKKVNVYEKFDLFDKQWSPMIVAELNDTYIKLVKLEGEFVWHKHDHEDEMFYVVEGEMTMLFKAKNDVHLKAGELIIIPKGVEHKPIADKIVKIMLVEPKTIKHTGDVESELTKTESEWI